jgi:hypothetical protein
MNSRASNAAYIEVMGRLIVVVPPGLLARRTCFAAAAPADSLISAVVATKHCTAVSVAAA